MKRIEENNYLVLEDVQHQKGEFFDTQILEVFDDFEEARAYSERIYNYDCEPYLAQERVILKDHRDKSFCLVGSITEVCEYVGIEPETIEDDADLENELESMNEGLAGYYIDSIIYQDVELYPHN